ncbi:MAG: glycosyltransferase family 4 protein [Chloroflexota bacterium]
MNILFIHEVDWLSKVVFEIHNLSEALSLLDHKVFAIDYENSWKKNSLFDLGSLKTQEFSVSRAMPKSSVYLRRPGFIKVPGLSRLSAGYTHYREIGRTIKEKNIDVVVLYSVPTNGLQTVQLANRFGVPVVFRSIDILHRLVPSPLLRQVTKFLESRVYSRVDMMLTITPRLSDYVIGLGAKESRVKLLPLPVDTNLFRPAFNCSETRQKWRLKEREPIILFIGTLFDFSGLDGFIREFPKVLEQVPEAKFLIVGDGPQRPKLENTIAELRLGNKVVITGFQPYETMPQYINLASVCINPFVITDATRDIFPSKILQYLACGKAVLATPLPGMLALIPNQSQGVMYIDSYAKMAIEAVNLLRSDRYRQELGQAGLSYVSKIHRHDLVTKQLETRLEEAIKEKRK